MIHLKDALNIHNILIDRFGGGKGVRDKGALEASLARPFSTFDNVELYPSPIEKASAVLESIVINHPFVDGNKRTGYVLMRLILLENGLDINSSQEDKYEMVIGVSKGELRIDDIQAWLSARVGKKNAL